MTIYYTVELAACCTKGRVGYTMELLADMYQAELCGYITTPYTVSSYVHVSLLQLQALQWWAEVGW